MDWPREILCCGEDVEIRCGNGFTVYDIYLFNVHQVEVRLTFDYSESYAQVGWYLEEVKNLDVKISIKNTFHDMYTTLYLSNFKDGEAEFYCQHCKKLLLTKENIKDLQHFSKREYKSNHINLIENYCKEIEFHFRGKPK